MLKNNFLKSYILWQQITFKKAYNLCSESFLCYDFFFLGRSYFLSQNYSLAIKYLEKASDCEKEKETLYDVYFELGQIYRETNDYENAILFFQKALSMTNNNLEISLSNFFIGLSLVKQEKAYEAIEYYKKSLDYELKYLKISENDVKNGRINNVDLGEIYFHLSVTCNFYGKQTTLESYFLKSKDYMIKAALCGYEDAIISCKKYGWRY